MKLALVQMTAAEVEQYEETAQKILCLAEEACSQGAEMILFPECAYPAYMIAVSYTHLDVYKRQRIIRTVGTQKDTQTRE